MKENPRIFFTQLESELLPQKAGAAPPFEFAFFCEQLNSPQQAHRGEAQASLMYPFEKDFMSQQFGRRYSEHSAVKIALKEREEALEVLWKTYTADQASSQLKIAELEGQFKEAGARSVKSVATMRVSSSQPLSLKGNIRAQYALIFYKVLDFFQKYRDTESDISKVISEFKEHCTVKNGGGTIAGMVALLEKTDYLKMKKLLREYDWCSLGLKDRSDFLIQIKAVLAYFRRRHKSRQYSKRNRIKKSSQTNRGSSSVSGGLFSVSQSTKGKASSDNSTSQSLVNGHG